MQICGQTLILVDNDATVSELNQKIVLQTLKYMFYHSPENRAYCLATYGHELEDEEIYTTDLNDLLCRADTLEYRDKDSNLTDVLASLLTNWKNSDFACRDIIVFTDGIEGSELNYEKEELYYLINNTSYPIYVVYLVQDNNAEARKSLSAIATTSDGKLFLSEFEGDDAGVDRQITEGIFERMDEYAAREWAVYEQNDEAGGNVEGQVNDESQTAVEEQTELTDMPQDGINLVGSIAVEADGSIIYPDDRGAAAGYTDFSANSGILYYILLGIFLVVIGGMVLGMLLLKMRRRDAKEEEEICEIASKRTRTEDFFDSDPFEEESVRTRLLDDGENATRLLDEEVHMMELKDISDASNKLVFPISDSVVIGRKAELCDVCVHDDSVSKRHCEISWEGNALYVNDQGSANGTFLNGERIIRSRMKNGDTLKIGATQYRVKCL